MKKIIYPLLSLFFIGFGISASAQCTGSASLTVTICSPACMPPSSLQESNVTSTTATVSWSAVAGATQYEIYGGRINTTYRSFTTANTSKSFAYPTIRAGKTYQWRVRALCANGWSAYTDYRTVAIPAAKEGEIVLEPAFSSITMEALPNPAINELTVSLSQVVEDATLTIIDLTGKRLQTQSLSGDNAQLDVSNLPAGMYIINVTNGDASLTQRFIKK